MLVVMYFDENGINQCGSSHTWILRDLKTVRGVLNRIKKHNVKPPKNTKTMVILYHYKWQKVDDIHLLDIAKKHALYVENY